MLKKPGTFLILIISVVLLTAVSGEKPVRSGSFKSQEQWVDSVMEALSPEQRIGQLFMVAAYSNKTEKHMQEIEELVSKYNIGGLIFFQGGPVRQAVLTNRYQSAATVPLLIAMDAEWGLGMRLDSTMSFPKQMTLGAIADDKYVYNMGREVAKQCRRLGVHINFAPVVDINSNPNNPVIGMRSFGEDKENVAAKGVAYMKGMQDHKVMANAKHFPGHGDTGTDSHLTLPVINHSKARMSETELFPFRRLIKDSVMSIMVAHIHVPAYDPTPNRATTLSRAVVTDLLKNEMGFRGLIFTDALNMKGVSSFYKPGEVDLLALLAGNDVLLYAENVPLAIKKIQKAVKDKDITQQEIDERVRKILRVKYWAGLKSKALSMVDTRNLYEDLHSVKAKAVQQELYEKAMTVVKNDQGLIPLKVLDTTTFASVSIGLESGNTFQKMLDNYTTFRHFNVSDKNADAAAYDKILNDAKKFKVVVVGLHGTSSFNNKDYGITENSKNFIKKLQANTQVVLAVFGNPYSLKYFTDSKNLICAYEDNEVTRKVVPQLIFGGIHATAKLPVTAHARFPLGTGLLTDAGIKRLRYGYPEHVGMHSATLNFIDSIVHRAMREKAIPGCQVMAVKNGTVVYDKTFGYLTYDNTVPVTRNTVYDIASISKVAGTLQAVMFLYERDLVNLDKKASFYLPELKNTNKQDLMIRDILTHQAGLVPFLPHWKKTIDTSGFNPVFYSSIKNDMFCHEVVPGMYCVASIEDSLWKWTIDSDLLKRPKKGRKLEPYGYVYSDLGFYILKKIVEKQVGQSMDQFVQQNFFDPLGLSVMSYNPLSRYDIDCIAPTEEDKYFRKCLVRGTVHDQGAAMLGGVAGHAGIFSNANDLAILMQMNLDGGAYGGTRYFLPGTIPAFTKKQFPRNRRGLGWDKPEPAGNGPTSDFASSNTFGHTGFTGTAAWVDPDHELVYIFLSNRVYPDASNNKIIKLSVRTSIQEALYRSIRNYQE